MQTISNFLTRAEAWHPVVRIGLIVGVALVAHLLVRGVQRSTVYYLTASAKRAHPKMRTIASLADSTLVFALYFLAIGFVLEELHVPLKAYLASASIVGLAVAFGTQGLVQDVVTGLTLVFSDLLDMEDMVDVGGQVGRVERVGLRFVVLRNYLGAEVYLPNRSVNSVIKYERGYVRAFLDMHEPGGDLPSETVEERVKLCMKAAEERFPGVFIRSSTIEEAKTVADGTRRLRAKCRIWPGQGAPLENHVRREVVETLRRLDPDYADWMVTVSYEVEEKTRSPRKSGR